MDYVKLSMNKAEFRKFLLSLDIDKVRMRAFFFLTLTIGCQVLHLVVVSLHVLYVCNTRVLRTPYFKLGINTSIANAFAILCLDIV